MATSQSIFEIVISGIILLAVVSSTSYVTGLGATGASVLVASSVVVWIIWKEKR